MPDQKKTNPFLGLSQIKKEILKKSFSEENEVRKRLGLPTLKEDYLVKPDKKFIGNYLMTGIAAGYTLSLEEMIDRVNDWIRKNLQQMDYHVFAISNHQNGSPPLQGVESS